MQLPSTFHVDTDGHVTFPIRASIEEDMHVQTLAIPGATFRPLLSRAMSRDNAPLNLPYLLAHTSDRGVFEHSRILTP
jgi:hypothetical protein